MKISFNFDPETNKVSEVSVTIDGEEPVVTKPKARSKKKQTLVTDKIIYNGTTLQLNQEVLDLIGAQIGDRLCVRFNPDPVLLRADIAREPKGGNLITKGLTIAAKGKTTEQLSVGEFMYKLKSEGYILLLEGNTVEDDNYPDPPKLKDKPIIGDISEELDSDDFIADLEGGVEVDFELDI
jgi:hypothetical protein